jgi:transcriptional regulator TrmB
VITIKENTEKIIKSLVLELDLSENEALIFLYIAERGKSTIGIISTDLHIDEECVVSSIRTLVEHGMIFNVTCSEYETFHPRFSIVNGHRFRCDMLGVPFKKNIKIDLLGAMLEARYEDGRTKYGA